MAVRKRKLFGFRLLIIFLSAAIVGTSNIPYSVGGNQSVHAELIQSVNKSGLQESNSTSKEEPYYYNVLKDWKDNNIGSGTKEYTIQAANYTRKSDDAPVKKGSYQGSNNVLLWATAKGWVEYDIEVEQEGLYEIASEYFPFSEKDGGNRRGAILSAQINGSYPYREARSMLFEREFQDQPAKFAEDGNQLRSLVEEIEKWRIKPFRDSDSAYSQPLLWHLKNGKNTIRLQISQQPLAIKSFYINRPTTIPSYEEVKKTYPARSVKIKEAIVIEAEKFSKKNSTSIQVQYDRNPLTTPKSYKNIVFNSLGGMGWYKGGHTVSWDFEVPEEGLYKIGMRVSQDFRKNLAVFRTIYIDGKIPFKEVQSYSFPYSSSWQGMTLEDGKGSPLQFNLTKGKHSIAMEAGYEPYMPVITQVDQMSAELKDILLQIKTATGNRQDDQFRVWNVDKDIPGVIDSLKKLQEQLSGLVQKLLAINKHTDTVAQAYKASAKDIEELLKKPEKIPSSSLTLGAVQQYLQEQYRVLMDEPLLMDKLYVAPVEANFPRMKATFFEQMKGMFASLRYSFVDRNQLGKQKNDEVNVWMLMGRDYVDELQQLADEKFMPKYGVHIKVNLIQSSDLLILAKAAGILPDVALGVPGGMPFEMAMRGEALNIKTMPGADNLIAKYHPGAMLPFYYDGGYYGIPETSGFKVLFYRKDILKKLGLKVPDTWDDVYQMIPTLLQNQYNFYVPPNDFSMMFFQNGAEIYTADGLSTALNKPEAFDAFKKWTDLFNIYGLERQVQSFYNQFRAGTMPIGVADYNMYMQLTVAAPDILNEWAIAPVPGTRKPDASVVRWAAGSNPTSAMMFKDSPANKRDLAWKFLQWYVSDEIQTEYGLDMEQLRGEAFRWNTANVRAFANMPWKKDDLKIILEQWKWLKEVPNVPGGYMSVRQLDFAWNRAVVASDHALESPRIALEKGIREITRELIRKQQEFHFRDKNGNVVKSLDLPQIKDPWKGAELNNE